MKKAIIHIDEQEKWSMVLSNISNLKKENLNFEIEVVINGTAIKGFLNPEVVKAVGTLIQPTILFAVCRNSMKSHNIKEEQLNPGVKIVPSGILEVIEQQHNGAAYIKP